VVDMEGPDVGKAAKNWSGIGATRRTPATAGLVEARRTPLQASASVTTREDGRRSDERAESYSYTALWLSRRGRRRRGPQEGGCEKPGPCACGAGR